jgi:chemotaxis receptor (MCP) glutamine deamidase CheD
VLVALFDAEAACGGAAVVSRDEDAERMIGSLMRQLEERGASSARLRAKIFGGAALAGADGDEAGRAGRAARLVEAVHASLDTLHVPIAAGRTCGHAPLEIMYHTDTGRALAREAPPALWRTHAPTEARASNAIGAAALPRTAGDAPGGAA